MLISIELAESTNKTSLVPVTYVFECSLTAKRQSSFFLVTQVIYLWNKDDELCRCSTNDEDGGHDAV